MEEGETKARHQLTYDDRLLIEQGLNRGDPIGMIARTIGRDASTVKREVQRNWTDSPRGMLVVRTRNICAKKRDCTKHGLCKTLCARECWRCPSYKCNALCPDFEAKPCPKLKRSPHCCNACRERDGYGCDYPYQFYEAKWADDLSHARRSESRAGIDMTPAEFEVQILCGKMYPKLFGLILTDRGVEFSNVLRMEHGRNGQKRSSVYFCDPLQSQQKGSCEKNHEELRRILPKGRTDFDALTCQDMAKCMSHINSYKRKSIDWFAPIDMARAVFPPDLIDGLGIEKVDAKKLI